MKIKQRAPNSFTDSFTSTPKRPSWSRGKAAVTKKPDNWETLYTRINAYVEAAIAESWKGGGDPSDIEIHEMRLKITRMELTNHIERIKAEHT